MSRLVFLTVFVTALVAASQASAGLLFLFTEEGDDVKMTASGSIDTSGLEASVMCGTWCVWDQIGFYQDGDHFLLGRDHDPDTQVAFGFHTGSDLSPWSAASGPFTADNFNFEILEDDGHTFGTFTLTESWSFMPGIAVDAADLVAGVWSVSQTWLIEDQSINSLGLIPGTYTITDSESDEFMTIQIPVPVPEPSTLGLLSIGLMGLMGIRRRQQAA